MNQHWEQMWKLHGEKLPWIVDHVQPSLKTVTSLLNPIKILEIGCGDGLNSFWLQSNGYDVTSIDISRSAIEFAKNKFPNLNKIYEKDIFSYDTHERFDLIFDRGCLHGFQTADMIKFVYKVYDLLSSHGYWLNISGKVCNLPDGPPQKNLSSISSVIEKRLEIISVNTVELVSQPNKVYPAWEILCQKK